MVAILLVTCLIGFLVFHERFREVVPQPTPTPTPLPVVAVAPTVAAPSPTPTHGAVEEVEDTVWIPLDTPTPTPRPPFPPLPARRSQWPRRGDPLDCLHYTAHARQSVAAWGQILFDIELENECGRDFEPLEIWFEITGYREGAVVQSVRGHPFFQVEAGHSEHLTIGLPGSLDWYDDVEVRILPPPPEGEE